MKKLIVGICLILGASLPLHAANRLVVNGFDQIPVQAALVLQEMKYDLLPTDWKSEAMDIMQESLEIVRIGESMNQAKVQVSLNSKYVVAEDQQAFLASQAKSAE